MDRRTFLEATVVAGAAVLADTALSYGRIIGANDRIRLAHIGIGSRGEDLVEITTKLKDTHHTEMAGVCDLWSVNRDKAVTAYANAFGRPPQAFRNVDDLLAEKNIDAVLISTPDHSHSPLLKMTAEAGKDVYVEKPMGNVLA
jgi:predicted dehydrogenase